MALPSSSQPLPRGGSSAPKPLTPRPTAPKPQSVSPPKDTSIFGGRQYVPAKEIENRWRGPSRQISGSSRILSQSDRLSTLKKMQDNYGTYIKPGNVDQFLKKLTLEKSGKSAQEQAKIDQDIKWLRGEFKGPGK